MSNVDHIPRVNQGDELSAARDGQILDAIDRRFHSPQSVTDVIGTYLNLPPKRAICRFEMTDELLLPQSGSGTANAYFLSWVEGGASGNLTGLDGTIIKVADTMRCHSKMQNPSAPGDETLMDVGAYGLAWIPDDPMVHSPYNLVWEILTMQTPGDFVGFLLTGETLQQHNPTPGAGGDQAWVAVFDIWPFPTIGHRTFGGFDPFGPVWRLNYGSGDVPHCLVYNLPREWTESADPPNIPEYYWFEASEGDFVYCRWCMREGKYYVVNMPSNLVVSGNDGANPVRVTSTLKIAFDTTDFTVTDNGDGSVSVALA